jgi:hypothetical protein
MFGEDFVFVRDTRIGRACVCRECGHRGAIIHLVANTKPSG